MSLRSQLGILEDLSSLSAYFGGSNEECTDNSDWTDSAWEWPNEEEKTENRDFVLHAVVLGVAPTAEALVFAKGEKFCIYSRKVSARDSQVSYQQSFKGKVINDDSTVEVNITAVSCIPVASVQKSAFGITDWICIVIGTKSGHTYFYTETGKVLLWQQFHDSCVQSIRCKMSGNSSGNFGGEVIIVYNKEIVCLEVFGLFQTLKACRNQLAGGQSSLYDGFQPPPLVFKKWGLSNQGTISDSVFVGMTVTNSFDHLVTASVQGGFNASVYGSPPLFYLYAATGSDPFLSFHYGQEGASNFVLSQVAMDIAGKVTSALFTAASSWFNGASKVEQKPKPPKIELPTPAVCRFGLDDYQRMGMSISLSPDSSLIAVTDSLARVLLIDVSKGTLVRLWKGYRNAECGWIQANNGTKSVLFLVIHVPKRGLLEVWLGQNGQRIAATNVPSLGRLISPEKGVVGQISATPLHQVLYLSPDGCLFNITVDYEQAITCLSNAKTRDTQLLQKLLRLFGTSPLAVEELLETVENLKSSEALSKALMSALTCRSVDGETLSKILNIISTKCDNEASDTQGRLIFQDTERIKGLVKLHSQICEISAMDRKASEAGPTETLQITGTSAESSAFEEIVPDLELHSEQMQMMKISEFLACFENCHKAEHRRSSCVKGAVSQETMILLSRKMLDVVVQRGVEPADWLASLQNSGLAEHDIYNFIFTYWLEAKSARSRNAIKMLIGVIKLFLSQPEKREAFIKSVESRVKETTNISDALILSLCMRYSIRDNSLENSGTSVTPDDEQDASKSEDWEGFSVDYVQWDMIVENFLDIYSLSRFTASEPSIAVSFNQLNDKGRGSVTEVVAHFLVKKNLNVVKLLDSVAKDDENEHSESSVLDFKSLKIAFPLSLDKERLLCMCSIEFMSAWAKNKVDVEKLSKSFACAYALENEYFRHGTAKMLWSSFLGSHFQLIASMTEEAGRIPSDAKYSRMLGASERHIPKFLRTCGEILDLCIQAGSHLTTERLPFFKYDPIFKDGRTPLFETAVQQRTINIDLALLHQQLCTTLVLVARFGIRNVKVLSLFDQDSKGAFFKDLGSYPVLPSGDPSYAIVSRRVQFLRRIVSEIVKDLTDKKKIEKWMKKVLDLARIWRCYDDEFKLSIIEILFSHSCDNEAIELSLTVNDLHPLGKLYLRVAAEQLKLHLLKSEMTAYFLSTLNPKVSSWLQRQAEPSGTETLEDTSMLLTKASGWISSDSFEYEVCLALKEAIVEVFEG